jgi:hypothetical protein
VDTSQNGHTRRAARLRTFGLPILLVAASILGINGSANAATANTVISVGSTGYYAPGAGAVVCNAVSNVIYPPGGYVGSASAYRGYDQQVDYFVVLQYWNGSQWASYR